MSPAFVFIAAVTVMSAIIGGLLFLHTAIRSTASTRKLWVTDSKTPLAFPPRKKASKPANEKGAKFMKLPRRSQRTGKKK